MKKGAKFEFSPEFYPNSYESGVASSQKEVVLWREW